MTFWSEHKHFQSWKCIWKYRVLKSYCVVVASMCLWNPMTSLQFRKYLMSMQHKYMYNGELCSRALFHLIKNELAWFALPDAMCKHSCLITVTSPRHYGVSNQRHLDISFRCLCMITTTETSQLWNTDHSWGESIVGCRVSSQRLNNAVSADIITWWACIICIAYHIEDRWRIGISYQWIAF